MADHETNPKEQPLISHLIELRDRLIRSLLAVLIIFCSLVAFSNDIYTFVAEPLQQALPTESGATMIATSVTAPFFAPIKLTLVLSIFIAIPYLLHQLWAFISPGLYRNEIRIALPILVSSVVLFYVGIAFAYLLVFHFVFTFFANIGPAIVTYMPDINSYLSFALTMFLAFGLTFEIPIATLLLIISGVTTPQSLSSKRPYVIIGCFVVGMLLTPADPFSQSMLAVPMWLLFESGIIAGRLVKKRERESEENNEEESPGQSSE